MSDVRRIHRELIAAQLGWASARELAADDSGTLADVRDNWLAPLHPESERELAAWQGSAGDAAAGGGGKSGPLHALGSGPVLAINCFDPWRGREERLAAALPGLVPAGARLRLWLGERSAASDGPLVLFESADGGATLLWPLFAEPFTDVDARLRTAPERGAELWRAWPACGLLADDLRCGPPRFHRLAAGAVLETALALAGRSGRHRSRLAVVYFDAPGAASGQLRREIDGLRMRVGGEVALLAASWQAIAARLPAADPADAQHVARLRARYFGAVPARRSAASMGGG